MYVHAGNTDDPEKMKQKYRFLDTMLEDSGVQLEGVCRLLEKEEISG